METEVIVVRRQFFCVSPDKTNKLKHVPANEEVDPEVSWRTFIAIVWPPRDAREHTNNPNKNKIILIELKAPEGAVI